MARRSFGYSSLMYALFADLIYNGFQTLSVNDKKCLAKGKRLHSATIIDTSSLQKRFGEETQ